MFVRKLCTDTSLKPKTSHASSWRSPWPWTCPLTWKKISTWTVPLCVPVRQGSQKNWLRNGVERLFLFSLSCYFSISKHMISVHSHLRLSLVFQELTWWSWQLLGKMIIHQMHKALANSASWEKLSLFQRRISEDLMICGHSIFVRIHYLHKHQCYIEILL